MRKIWCLMVLGALLSGFSAQAEKAPACVKNGVKYGVTSGAFRSEWWNYQERAMSYIDGGCYEPALADIEKAIKLRTALVKKDCDQRRARTYGMWFVDYFGHRGRGIALYHLGRIDEAQKELEFSLSCVESSQAQYYLDLVRKQKIESGQLDKTPPMMEIAYPPNQSYTNQSQLTFKGKALDDTLVKEIWVGSEAVVIPVAEKEVSFEQKLVLSPGWNNFKLRAVDITGKQSSLDWSVFLDQEGPEVSIADIRPLAGAELEVSGEVLDQAPISRLVFNNREVALQAGRAFTVRLNAAPQWKIFFKASDVAGNSTEGVINLTGGPKGARLFQPAREAGLDNAPGNWPGRPLPEYQTPFSLEMSRKGESAAELAFTELYWNLKERYDTYTDKDPPVIQLRGFRGETTVYFPELYLEGLVSDGSLLKEVSINDKPLLKSQRKNMFFNCILPLKEGANRITIRALDANGNLAEKVIRVFRVVPQVHQLNERLVVSMLPFRQMGQVQEIGVVGYDNLITAIVNQQRFNFVDRSKIEAIVRELKLSAEQLVDPNYTLKVGKMTSAEGMIIGYVKEAPSSIEIYAQLVDVETGTILAEKDAYNQDKSLEALKFLTRGLAIRLRENFPLLEGKVVKLDGKKALLDIGASQKLRPGMKVIFFQEQEIKDADSGLSLGKSTEKLGLGKIIEVYDKMSLVEPEAKVGNIAQNQAVITK